MNEYLLAIQVGDLNKRSKIEDEVNRDSWKQFVSSAQARDLGQVFKYLARAAGKRAMSYRPARLGPLRDRDRDSWRFAPERNANLLGAFVAEKTAQT